MQSRSGKAKRVAQIERSLQSAKSADRLLLSEENARAVSNGLTRAFAAFAAADTVGAVAITSKRSGAVKLRLAPHKALLMHRGCSVGTTSPKYCVLADLIPVCHHLLRDIVVQTRG